MAYYIYSTTSLFSQCINVLGGMKSANFLVVQRILTMTKYSSHILFPFYQVDRRHRIKNFLKLMMIDLRWSNRNLI